MLNFAGASYDFGNVLFAVLQECEHRRRGLLSNQAEQGLLAVANDKLQEIRRSYRERGGAKAYWRELQREVLETVLPQYVVRAAEQTRLERDDYDIWRRGDPLARAVLGIGGLAVGGLLIRLPFIPIVEDSFALALAAASFFYPEIKRLVFDYRHARFLNRLIAQAEKYQKDRRIHYVSNQQLDEALSPFDPTDETEETEETDAGDPGAEPAPYAPPPPAATEPPAPAIPGPTHHRQHEGQRHS